MKYMALRVEKLPCTCTVQLSTWHIEGLDFTISAGIKGEGP
jgi:hypothetical protein